MFFPFRFRMFGAVLHYCIECRNAAQFRVASICPFSRNRPHLRIEAERMDALYAVR
jgi:hypothetical protein